MIARTIRRRAEYALSPAASRPPLRRRSVCQFIALALFGAGSAYAATPPPFSAAWLAAKQPGAPQAVATPLPGDANLSSSAVFTPGNIMLQQRVQQSIANLDTAAQAVAAQLSAQKSAQQAAQQLVSSVPNGLATGGLTVDTAVATNPTLWQNANAPTQSIKDGQTTVDIKQTAAKSILSWESFNVGRNTTVHFDQTGGSQTDGGNQWIALNRINDPAGKPSQILGAIKAEGTVYLINRNGMVFGAGSQVDTHSLLATSLDLFSDDRLKSNAFFLSYGVAQTSDPQNILGGGSGSAVSAFLLNGLAKDSSGAIVPTGGIQIEKGALIATGKQGFALLAAPDIRNNGQIVADDGQVMLAALGSVGYAPSTNVGGTFSLVASDPATVSPGQLENSGLIQARRGSVQWLGSTMVQNGTVAASTSLSHPGSVTFDSGSPSATTTFGTGSVTTILPDMDGETTSSTAAATAAFVTSVLAVNTRALLDKAAMIEVPAGHVSFNMGSYIDADAIIDVSGLANVQLPLSALLLTIPRIGQNELADSPLQRNGFLYTQKNVVLDSTQSGTRADGVSWVGSPILNATGYAGNVPRSVDQLMTKGGSIAFLGQTVVRTGAQLRLEGGFVNYLPGSISTPRLQASNGLIYDIADADPNTDYVGFAGTYDATHARWGVTESYASPLLTGSTRVDPGFIRGDDAGQLSFAALNATPTNFIIDGDVSAHAYAGREQVRLGTSPNGGSLSISALDLASQQSLSALPSINYVVQKEPVKLESVIPDFDAQSEWPIGRGDPNDPRNPLYWHTLSTAMIDNAGFRRVSLQTPGTVLIDPDTTLSVTPGGSVAITAPRIDVEGTIQARSGSIALTSSADFVALSDKPSLLTLGSGGRLDTSGIFVNDAGKAADDIAGSAYINGGAVSLTAWQGVGAGQDQIRKDSTGDVLLMPGSVIDVSSGAYVSTDGKLAMNGTLVAGRGGDVSVRTHVSNGSQNSYQSGDLGHDLLGGRITLGGTIDGYGFSGGGEFTLEASQIAIGGAPVATPDSSLVYLAPSFSNSGGFSGFNLTAETDATVADATAIVVQPVYRLPNITNLLVTPTGQSLEGALWLSSLGTVSAYQRHQVQPDAAGLTIAAGHAGTWEQTATLPYAGVDGSLMLGADASITVDAGASVSLSSTNNVTILGDIHAPGGTITLKAQRDSSQFIDTPGRALWLGAASVLDAAGTTLLNPLAGAVVINADSPVIQRTGTVLDGGSVDLISDRNVVAERGSVVDISGTSATFDVRHPTASDGVIGVTYAPVAVWSDAGSLGLNSAYGLMFDGNIDAHGGAEQARGGQLTLTPVRTVINGSNASPSAIVLQQSGYLLAAGAEPGQSQDPDRGSSDRLLRFAVDRLDGSGIADLVIGTGLDTDNQATYRNVPLYFSGDVKLDLARSFQVDAPSVAVLPAGVFVPPATGTIEGAGHVSISAPYVGLQNTYYLPASPPVVDSPALTGDGTLSLSSSFMDLGGALSLKGIGKASFASTGDIRFTLPAIDAYVNGQTHAGWLYSTGDLDFTAARIYPSSNYAFVIDAVPVGLNSQGLANETTVAFHRVGETGSTPLSAGGSLVVSASHVEQGGVLWAPSGTLVLGVDDASTVNSSYGITTNLPYAQALSVHLAPGSLTSVSLDGAVVPFGTTADGKDWSYSGDPGATSPVLAAPPAKHIDIQAASLQLDQGATVDISGGGHVQATEWVPGTGGSRDVLAQSSVTYAQSPQGVQVSQYADGRPVYAIVPGYAAPLSAHDAALEKGAGAGPDIGQGVYLQGVAGLADGVYTLLPARYATLPGSYRVVQQPGAAYATVGQATVAPDGSAIVAGYGVDTLTGARDALPSLFSVQSRAVWGQYSEYNDTSAETYFSNLATQAGSSVPQLGADAGRLSLAATQALTLGARLAVAPNDEARGAEVDIAGDAIQVMSSTATPQLGYLQVDADGLSNLGAASLLIGGKRTDGATGEYVDVLAHHILIDSSAAHPLQGPDIMLVARGDLAADGIVLSDNSVLRSVGTVRNASETPLIIGREATSDIAGVSGNGALIRVSNSEGGSVSRLDVASGPSAGGSVTVGSGAVLGAGQFLNIDLTGQATIAPDASLAARDIDLTADRIGLSNAATDDGTHGFLLGSQAIGQLAAADNLTLRGRESIDFLGSVALSVANTLTLTTPDVTSDGGHISLRADTLRLGNDRPGSSLQEVPGDASLSLDVGALDFFGGNAGLSGFASLDGTASRMVQVSGPGQMDFGAADVLLYAPGIVAQQDAAQVLTTTGDLSILRNGRLPVAARSLGGDLTLEGGNVLLGTDLVAASGNITLHATQGDVKITDDVLVDVAGVAKPFHDTSVFVPGGTLTLHAAGGDVDVGTGATLDFSGASGGNAGRLSITADAGAAVLAGQMLGHAASGYLGGNLFLDTAAPVDLSGLAARLASGGVNGTVTVHTRSGALSLDAAHTLTAHDVSLTADGDGGYVRVDGAIDASGRFGGNISLFGSDGIDIEGTLRTNATDVDHVGGDITLGTTGQGDGSFNATYGYENVTSPRAGTIAIGPAAHIDQAGTKGNGRLLIRVPLLADGDVNLAISPDASIAHTREVAIEPFAIWSTDDASVNPALHFDGLVDPAGWFAIDPLTGAPALVAGSFTDASGNPVVDLALDTATEVADALARYYFTPTASNAAHQGFYSYVNGDASQGPGALMGFVQNPGFLFSDRLASVPHMTVHPGIELRNPDASINGGNITVLTPWNLGAGTQNADGSRTLAYRYNGVAPNVTLRANNDLDIRASITDGFFQQSNVLLGPQPRTALYEEASADYQTFISLSSGDYVSYPDLFPAPVQLTSGDELAIKEYYGQYMNYSEYLAGSVAQLGGGGAYIAADPILLGLAYGFVVSIPDAPVAPALPVSLNTYPAYLAQYGTYLIASATAADFSNTISVPDTFQALLPPPTTLDRIVTEPALDNSPSPVHSANNPLALASANLMGGSSSSYRLVAGANFNSADPLAVQAGAALGANAGRILLDGHTDYNDPISGRTLYTPTLVRTGTGDIDLAASSDIRWLDAIAPTAIYAAGAPAAGTDAQGTSQLVQPALNPNLVQSNTPETVLNGAVNPVDGGHVALSSGGSILGIQNTVDSDGSSTGLIGASTAQYWWPWMQMGNTSTRTSINFGAFDQGLMSVGGNITLHAAGDISQVSASLPTTWMITADATGARNLATFGGGDLSVVAEGNILSGSYFVAKGNGLLHAGNAIAPNFTHTYVSADTSAAAGLLTTPVSTIIAMQDANFQVEAGRDIDIGGIFNPSLIDSTALSNILPAGHADGQNYSATSSVSVRSDRGDLVYGSLAEPATLFVGNLIGALSSGIQRDNAGDILPATVELAAASGDLTLRSSGELFPAEGGNLSLLAQGAISFDKPADGSRFLAWGLIDAPASQLASPLDTSALMGTDGVTGSIRAAGYLTPDATGPAYHQAVAVHALDTDPVRVYALDRDITNGVGGGSDGMFLVLPKVSRIDAGRDILDLAYIGQQSRASDISSITAARDILDTPLVASPPSSGSFSEVFPVILQAGPGNLLVEAGRNIGRLASQTEFYGLSTLGASNYVRFSPPGSSAPFTGIDSIGNTLNPSLPYEGAGIHVLYGVAPGVDENAFIQSYVNPASGVQGVSSLGDDLTSFVAHYEAGLVVDTGYLVDAGIPNLTLSQAWATFVTLPDDAKSLFVQTSLFKILKEVGKDYNDPLSPNAGKYERGYAALNTLFPASLGYTANAQGGGLNGATTTISTGDLDIRGTTIQTQQGGDVAVLAPGGQALLGSTSSPPVLYDARGDLLAGPNTMGVLTLRSGDIDIFTDKSVLLAQSRIFTEQGGDVTIWSSNGNINAGKGAKTVSDIPPVSYVCNTDAWCSINPSGQVSGAGIATLQSTADTQPGSVYLVAPRGTVDAGDAGIRVSGNLIIAAAQVANGDNITVQGEKIGVPSVQAVNVAALTAASSAASAASKAAEDVARKQQNDSRDRMPSVISVEVLGSAGPSASIDDRDRRHAYDPLSPVQVIGFGKGGLEDSSHLTPDELIRLSQ